MALLDLATEFRIMAEQQRRAPNPTVGTAAGSVSFRLRVFGLKSQPKISQAGGRSL
jgi:hypothetical protein